MADKQTVLVTGASGFIALHCIHQLLQAGYRVRGSLRSLEREGEVRETLAAHLADTDDLSFAAADLTEDAGWSEAVAGCDFVLHVASPYPEKPPSDENELIVPAREGALRVLRAAAKAGVRRTVLTSSMAATGINQSHPDNHTLDESDWTDTQAKGVGAYEKSKTLAEKAAWDFIETPEAGGMTLSVINPGLVFGPVLGRHAGTSAGLVKQILERKLPACPRICLPLVDVRDVAAAHIAALTAPAAAGQRFCCTSTTVWLVEVADVLHRGFAAKGFKVPTGTMPNWLFRAAALFDSSLRPALANLGRRYQVDNRRIREVLDWQPRGLEEMVTDLADSLIRYGIVETK